MATFEEVMALASLPEDRLTLCLDAKLGGQLDALRAQLADAPPPTSLGERSPAAVIRDQIDELIVKMRAAEATFVIRALSGREWTALWLARPDKADGEDGEAYARRLFPWTARLVAACCVDPVMTTEQVGELVDLLHGQAWVALQAMCMDINMGKVEVPNFAIVSGLIPNSETTLPPQSDSGSATPPSSERNGRVPRRTPTKRAAKATA